MNDTGTAAPEHSLQLAATNAGLTMLDLISVVHVLQAANGPAGLIDILNGTMQQVRQIGAALDATRGGLLLMQEARNQALQALEDEQTQSAHVAVERDIARDDLVQLQTDLSQWNRNNPAIAALIDEVWQAAQTDLIERARSRKGA
jgi:hypothetical protein